MQVLDYDRSRLDFAAGAELTFVAKGDQVPLERLQGEYARALG